MCHPIPAPTTYNRPFKRQNARLKIKGLSCHICTGLIAIVHTIEDILIASFVDILIVTITTVGYGDFSPVTTIGRGFISLMIMFTAVPIPYSVSQLIDLIRAQDKYGRSFNKRRSQVRVSDES